MLIHARPSFLKARLDFENSEENLIIWIQVCSKPIRKYFIDYLKTNFWKKIVLSGCRSLITGDVFNP